METAQINDRMRQEMSQVTQNIILMQNQRQELEKLEQKRVAIQKQIQDAIKSRNVKLIRNLSKKQKILMQRQVQIKRLAFSTQKVTKLNDRSIALNQIIDIRLNKMIQREVEATNFIEKGIARLKNKIDGAYIGVVRQESMVLHKKILHTTGATRETAEILKKMDKTLNRKKTPAETEIKKQEPEQQEKVQEEQFEQGTANDTKKIPPQKNPSEGFKKEEPVLNMNMLDDDYVDIQASIDHQMANLEKINSEAKTQPVPKMVQKKEQAKKIEPRLDMGMLDKVDIQTSVDKQNPILDKDKKEPNKVFGQVEEMANREKANQKMIDGQKQEKVQER